MNTPQIPRGFKSAHRKFVYRVIRCWIVFTQRSLLEANTEAYREKGVNRVTRLVRHVLCLPGEDLNGMGQHVNDSFERLNRTSRTARQVQHHRSTTDAAHTAAQGRERRLLLTLTTHALGHSVEHSSANRACCFRGNVSRRDSSSSGSDHEASFPRQFDNGLQDCGVIVGYDAGFDHREVMALKSLRHRRPRKIVALPASARVTDRQNCCAEGFRNRGGRHLPPRRSHLGLAALHPATGGPPSGGPGYSGWWSAA